MHFRGADLTSFAIALWKGVSRLKRFRVRDPVPLQGDPSRRPTRVRVKSRGRFPMSRKCDCSEKKVCILGLLNRLHACSAAWKRLKTTVLDTGLAFRIPPFSLFPSGKKHSINWVKSYFEVFESFRCIKTLSTCQKHRGHCGRVKEMVFETRKDLSIFLDPRAINDLLGAVRQLKQSGCLKTLSVCLRMFLTVCLKSQ